MEGFGYPKWLDVDSWPNSRMEAIIMPDLPIVDPHHHLWIRNDGSYLFPDFVEMYFLVTI